MLFRLKYLFNVKIFLSTSFLICTASYCPEMLASASCLYAMKLSILKYKKKKTTTFHTLSAITRTMKNV